ncbi:MAG TPA: lytic transglycosylase domain-containing protein [Thermoanaerobaculia bacterium]|nr:lytic transglycosylase domain-containing protein [Thermoanaerobaculia bacterium]
MLQFVRRRWIAATIAVVLLIGGGVTLVLTRDGVRERENVVEEEQPSKAEAPPDLEKLQESYAAGTAALQRDDGAEAVKQFGSFSFGPRAVEEYRLYYLANGHQLTGNSVAARVTLAQLWRREPRMVYRNDVGFNLASLYETAGDFERGAEVYADVARRADVPEVAASARLQAAMARLRAGDPSAALFNARMVLIDSPASKEAKEAGRLVRALTGLPDTAPYPLSPSERLERATALSGGEKPQDALLELDALDRSAPHLKPAIQVQRGITLHRMRRYEDSNKVLEPLTSGPFKYAIPALHYGAKNYAIVAASINPEIIKTVKERKKVGTVKQRVGKGKKRRTVTKPKYQTVFRQVKLIDLAKKKKKDEYDRLASERLKDLLMLPQLSADLRVETLNSLINRAASKNQDAYVMELVPQIIKLEPSADPALQHFWDRGWAMYARGDLNGAKKHFRFIADTYTHPNVRRQSEYWYARSLDRQGQKEAARAIYQKLADAPYEDLYAQHAINRGAKRGGAKGGNPLKRGGPDWRELAQKEMPKELELAYELSALSSMREAFLEARKNVKRENQRFAHAIMADFYHSAGNQLLMYTELRKAWPQLATVEQDSVPPYFFKMYYPLKYGEEIEEYAKERKLDPNLVRGLILQESYYNPKARSRVGATGLMQLMPPTASEHARRMRIPFAVKRLETPDVNIRLGTYHLRMLIDMFRGNTHFAVASYNAGQGNVLKWRRAAPGKPTDEFLESIPFQETRNYVKRVTMLRSTYARITS